MRTDVHQHLWTEPLVAALAARREPPFLTPDGAGWRLTLAGEPSCSVGALPQDAGARAGENALDGVDLAIVAPSSPLGIEGLPGDEARELLAAYDDGADGLGPGFRAWGSVALHDLDPDDVDALLDRGRVGLCLPSGAVGSAAGLDRVGPLLERLERRGAPLFVHPGPSPWAPPAVAGDDPCWWPALTSYVASMQAAWLAWFSAGRPAHPRLRVLFAALAGLAPLHGERLTARGGGVVAARASADRDVFYDTSSYGELAVAALEGVVPPSALVHGSDRPYALPRPGEAGRYGGNVSRLIGPVAVGA